MIGKSAEIIVKYCDEYSVTELAREYNVNVSVIKNIILKNDLCLRSPAESRNLSRYNKKRNETIQKSFTENEIGRMTKQYSEGYGINYIANQHSVDPCVIQRVLTENGNHIRNWEEQQLFKQKTVELTRQTIIKNGGWSIIQQKHQDAVMKKYGVCNVMHIPQVLSKQQKSAFKTKQLSINGKTFAYQGYEDKAIKLLLECGYTVDDIVTDNNLIPVIDYTFKTKNKKYFPDIFIPKDNLIIEVKSTYTMNKHLEQNICKHDACIEQGYDIDFIIFGIKS